MVARYFLPIVLLLPLASLADIRCGAKLAADGAALADVIESCGQPAARAEQGPALRSSGVPRKGADKLEVLVYGPRGGAWQYLLFRNGKLLKVEMRRQPPEGDLLKW